MASTLQIVDPDNLTTVLFDFNDSTGLNNVDAGSVRTGYGIGGAFDLGSPESELSLLSSASRPGGSVVFRRDPVVVSSWRLRMEAASYDSLVNGVNVLSSLLAKGGVVKWVPHGSSEVRYIDFEPSSAPALLRGQGIELYAALHKFDSPEGVLIAVLRQPYLRGPELDPLVNKLVNSTLLADSDGAGRPDLWAWDSTTNITAEEISAATEAYRFTIATAAARNLQQSTGAASAAPGEVWVLSFYARVVAVAGTPRARAVIEFQSSVPATLATATGSLVTLTTAWQRVTVVSAAAPASTDRIRASLRMENASATSVVVEWRFAQLERASAPSLYRVGQETLNMDPASAGLGRVLAVYIHGSAPARPRLLVGGNSAYPTWGVRSRPPIVGKGALTEYLNAAKFFQIEGWTLGTDTTAAVDAGASPQSGNTHAAISFGTNATHILRASTTITDAGILEALKGRTWRVRARVTMGTATSTFSMQMKWAWGALNSETAANEGPIVTEEIVTTSPWLEFDLGDMTFPDETPDGLDLFFFAGRSAGTGALKVDFLFLVPVETMGYALWGQVLTSDKWSEVDSDKGEARVLDSNLKLTFGSTSLRRHQVVGVMPVLQPGLNIVAVPPFSTNTITHTYPVRVYYSPLYHA